ncbi:hypothetical protein KKG65_01515 [Patescibacteria group bacterium]|nr:hypothetical protein [Patescibacteria group bacterium]MBU1200217.1 hypothetical protein [Patescibacteria group bacterium]MBU1256668.1 hypothetical protein [Patescibacteria group bacterium]MBU1457898.1 hypothetical protein [Patescibacteria group bacterium]
MDLNPTYSLSYFRTNAESALDIILNTQNQTTNGFQIVFQITADPSLSIIDQNPNLDGVQLDIINHPNLNFLTNRVKPILNGYQIELAAITSNPSKPVAFQENTTIAKLIFTQPATGTITINQDNQFTEISTQNSSQTTPSTDTKPTTISTQPTGQPIQKLGGQMYTPPTPVATTTISPTPTTGPFISTPIIITAISITLGLVALIYTIRQLKN